VGLTIRLTALYLKVEWKSSRNFTIVAHVCSWVVFLAIPLLLAPGPGFSEFLHRPESMLALLIKMAFWLSIFYVNLLIVFPSLMRRGFSGWHIALFIVAVVAISWVVAWIELNVHGGPPPRGIGPEGDMGPPADMGPRHMDGGRRGPGLGGPFFSNLLMTILVFSASSFLALWNDWRNTKEMERDRAMQRVAAELSMLKLQISPHFLFNTLNNIRWLIRSGSDAAENAVVKLSQLLRYILYQASADFVPLETEINHLKDFISLQQMRLTDAASFSFNVIGSPGDKMIVPLLFLPLAENLFKHGDFGGSFINTMTLELQESRVVFSAVNKILSKVADGAGQEQGGIGVSNLRRRLALHYPEKHVLDITESEGTYRVKLEILF
jgi:hypothetical protein